MSKLPPAKKGQNIKGTYGGYRPGVGMPKGKKIKRTLEKEHVKKQYDEKITAIADQLFHAQKVLALGSYTLFLVEHYEDQNGKVKSRKVLVEDKETMEAILNNPDMVQGDNYVVVQTNSPDKFVISDMLDRAFGRAVQSVEQTNINLTPQDVINSLDDQ